MLDGTFVGTLGHTSPLAVFDGWAAEMSVFHVAEKLLKRYRPPLPNAPKVVTSIVSASGEYRRKPGEVRGNWPIMRGSADEDEETAAVVQQKSAAANAAASTQGGSI
jgi:hypothetical protein